ncbi:MAG: tyrosine-type recombinase/integrase [Candidatus Dormibacteria bacterium]
MRRRRPTRRDPGDGSIFQRGDGRWVARLKLPDGRYRYLYGENKAAVKARLVEVTRAVDEGRPVPDARLTVGAYLEQWLAGLPASGLKPATIAYYRRYVRFHVLTSELARMSLARLDAADLRRLYAEKLESGLSSTTVHHLHAVLHLALNKAVEDGKAARNVAGVIGRGSRPKVAHKEMTTIADGDQPRRFLTAAHGDRLDALLVLALTTGMRQGELRALRWKDVHLDRDPPTLAVVGSLQGDRRATLSIGAPKSGKTRVVRLSGFACDALQEHRKRQDTERRQLATEWHDQGLVFTTLAAGRFGEYVSISEMRGALRRALETASLPMIRFHDLRHTAASILMGGGAHPKVASEMLGHASVGITLDLYSHVTQDMQQSAVDIMDRAFREDKR